MKVFLVDDESIANARLRHLLKSFPQVEIVGDAMTVDDAIKQIIKLKPELVFIDMEIDGEIGFRIMEEAEKQGVKPRYIVVSGFSHYSISAIRHKVDDYLLKPVNIAELKSSLESIQGDRKLEYVPMESTAAVPLSGREKTVLVLILGGKTSEEIGEELNLSRHTIDTYRRNILRKLGVKNTMELIRRSTFPGNQ